MTRIYYQLEFIQQAPLRIGAGFGEQTDTDVIRDRRGMPFLPGSSIAGLLRSEFDTKTAERLFGFVRSNGDLQESRVQVSDAVLPAGAEVRISTRDGVGLNERKVAKKGAKYDFQVVETEQPYRAVLELTDESLTSALESVLSRWAVLGVFVGARTTRGYGRMAVSVRSRSFRLPDDVTDWLAYDPFGTDAFQDSAPWEPTDWQSNGMDILRAELQIKGSFSVRVNISAPGSPDDPAGEDSTAPDTVPMENLAEKPVVPGTSWAGAILHHLRALAEQLKMGQDVQTEIDALFGTEQEKAHRSAIRFSETEWTGCERMLVTRTAIDRFTSAPRKRALFTSEIAVGGKGELIIMLPSDTDSVLKCLLGAALCDLHLGLLGFGGENGVGRGIAEITGLSMNGSDRTEALHAGRIADIWKEDAVC